MNATRRPLVELVKAADFYKKGLQKNHKDLVDMGEVGRSLCYLLDNLLSSQNLNAQTYEGAMAAYKPFISRYRPYEEVISLLTEDNAW
jgi:hypothetical protein